MQNKKIGSKLFQLVSGVNFLIALLHFGMVVVGTKAYEFFDAGEELVALSKKGSLLPALITLGITLFFGFGGIYTWFGGVKQRKLPLLIPVLLLFAIIYLLRGLAGMPALVRSAELMDSFISLICLVVGIMYVFALIVLWKELKR